MAASDQPALSVVVAIVSDTVGHPEVRHLDGCLEALTRQLPLEIIVPYHPSVDGIARMRRKYPDVRFIEAARLATYTGQGGSREHHDELRARGLAEAKGRIVALVEDCGIIAPDWSAQVLEAHRQPYAAIGGAIENGIGRPLNWAVYFCDFLRYQNPLAEGESPIASDANVTYKREALEAVRPVWNEIFHEWSVNQALRALREKVVLAPRIVLYQHRLGLGWRTAVKERYVWGRSYAATRAGLAGAAKRAFWAAFSPALPLLMLGRMTLMAIRKRRTIPAYFKAFPITTLLVVSWCCGELVGYLTGRANAQGTPAAEAITRGAASTPPTSRAAL
jgi:hypothetical protein